MRGPRLAELALLASLIPLPLTSVALAGQTEAPKKVLVLYWYHKDFPGNVAFDQSFRTALQSARRGAVEYYPEYFETNRLPWNAYRWYIVGIILLCLVETALLCGLLIQRARYKRVQEGLRESEQAVRESNLRIKDLAGRLIAAQEEERKHIARELHDDLNQQVAVLAITIGTFKRQISSTDVVVLEQMSRLQETLVGMSEHIRRLSHELHSSVLQHVGPVVAIQAYCQEFTDREGIALTVDIQDGFEPVSTDLSLCVYRVLQESLRNVARHSGTDTAEVKLTLVQDAVELHVTDHGVGFDPNLAESRKGLGLVSMEERVKLLRGTFQLKTRPGAGTEIKVRIPITGDQGA